MVWGFVFLQKSLISKQKVDCFHLLRRRLGQVFERERDADLVVLDLTDLAKRQQLDLVHTRVLRGNVLELCDILLGIIEGWNDDLPQRGGNVLLLQICQKLQRLLQRAAHVTAVKRVIGIFDIQ